MAEKRKVEKERKKREKEERRRREKEEKARRKAEKQALREQRRREKQEATAELQELPSPRELEGEALTCPPRDIPEAEIPAGEESLAAFPSAEGTMGETGGSGTRFAQDTALPEEMAGERPGGEEILEEYLEVREEALEEGEGWFQRLRRGLSRSRRGLTAPLSRALAARRFDEAFWEEVEEILVGADVGMEMTMVLVDRVKDAVAREKLREPEELLSAFRKVVAEVLDRGDHSLHFAPSGPCVFMVVGVNGTGKTTTIAKIAHYLKKEGKRVLLAAGDTFRAAGIEQLEAWGERVGVHTVKHRQGADAAAVVHDAVESARARGIDVVIADTAGRLHTKANLMEELRKIKRVAERSVPVTETLLVIDATTGQNGLIQARQFKEAVGVTGVVLTKLDGTAKGGIVVAIAHDLDIPIKFIGVGERLDDLHPFDPDEFAEALFSA